MPDNAPLNRGRFFSAAATTVVAAQLGALAPVDAQSGVADSDGATTALTPQPGAHTSFGSVKQIDAGS